MKAFRFNGFLITVLSEKVIASDGNVSLTFKTLDIALKTLGDM